MFFPEILKSERELCGEEWCGEVPQRYCVLNVEEWCGGVPQSHTGVWNLREWCGDVQLRYCGQVGSGGPILAARGAAGQIPR